MLKKLQISVILSSAVISSLGTYPYAKNFSQTIFSHEPFISIFSIFFIVAAVSCNILLATHSLLHSVAELKSNDNSKQIVPIVISFISALANGFICFLGYSKSLSPFLNIAFSAMVVLVNAGIGYSGICSLRNDFRELLTNTYRQIKQRRILQTIILLFTYFAALIASLTVYLASAHFLHTTLNTICTKYWLNLFTIIIWIPWAALFLNSSYKIVNELIKKSNTWAPYKYFSKRNILIFTIAGFSGSAYAQMAFVFYDTNKNIPYLFKIISSHNYLLHLLIIPTAFIMSSLLNAYALKKIAEKLKI